MMTVLSGNPTVYSIPYKEIIEYLNKKTGKHFKHNTAKSKDFIKARWNQDFRLEDFKKVIDIKTAEWLNTDSDKYLRPETLFGNKFEGYLNQKAQPTGIDQLERMNNDRKLLGLGGYYETTIQRKDKRKLENINLLMSKKD